MNTRSSRAAKLVEALLRRDGVSEDAPPEEALGDVGAVVTTRDGRQLVAFDGVARGGTTTFLASYPDVKTGIFYVGEDPKQSSDGMEITSDAFLGAEEVKEEELRVVGKDEEAAARASEHYGSCEWGDEDGSSSPPAGGGRYI